MTRRNDSWTAVRRWRCPSCSVRPSTCKTWAIASLRPALTSAWPLAWRKLSSCHSEHPIHHAFLSTAHCLKLSKSSLIWDLLSTLPTVWTTKSTNELERLRPISGDSVHGFSNSHHLTIKLKVRVYSTCVLTVLRYIATRRGAHTAAKKTVSTHFISDPFPAQGWINFTANCITRFVELGQIKLRYKDVVKRDMASFHISPQSWETLLPIATDDVPLWVTVIHCQLQTTQKNVEAPSSSSSTTGWTIVVVVVVFLNGATCLVWSLMSQCK